MHLPFSTPEDPRPEDQAENAAHAQPNPHDPAVHAAAPNYGQFGHPDDAAAAAANGPATGRNDGSNDNPDEFSEFRTAAQPDSENYAPQAQSAAQAGAASYNGGRAESHARPAGFEKAEDVARDAFAEDDPRYAGGGTQSSWPSNEPAQENTDLKGGYDPSPKV